LCCGDLATDQTTGNRSDRNAEPIIVTAKATPAAEASASAKSAPTAKAAPAKATVATKAAAPSVIRDEPAYGSTCDRADYASNGLSIGATASLGLGCRYRTKREEGERRDEGNTAHGGCSCLAGFVYITRYGPNHEPKLKQK
jgi:hypothetical protein